MTGMGMAEDRRRTAAAGFVAHVVKPATANELLAALGEVCRLVNFQLLPKPTGFKGWRAMQAVPAVEGDDGLTRLLMVTV